MSLTLKMVTGSRLWFCKIIPKAACDKLSLAHFPCSQWEVCAGEHRPIKTKGILWKVSVGIFSYKISKQVQRSKYKVNNCISSEKVLKDLENYQFIHRKYWFQCLDLRKIYPSRDTVPFTDAIDRALEKGVGEQCSHIRVPWISYFYLSGWTVLFFLKHRAHSMQNTGHLHCMSMKSMHDVVCRWVRFQWKVKYELLKVCVTKTTQYSSLSHKEIVETSKRRI